MWKEIKQRDEEQMKNGNLNFQKTIPAFEHANERKRKRRSFEAEWK